MMFSFEEKKIAEKYKTLNKAVKFPVAHGSAATREDDLLEV
jgi:hypothetical protein